MSPMRTTMSSGRSPSSSATTCASTVPMPVPMSCTLDSTSTEPSRRMRTSQDELVCTLAPHSDCAMPMPRLMRAAIAGGRAPAAPAEALGADAALLAPHRARIDAVAQRERIEAELLGQFVDHLLIARRRRARCRARAWRSRARH